MAEIASPALRTPSFDEARYLFDSENLRAASEPPEDLSRLIWIFLTLIRTRQITLASFERHCRRSPKTFKRDLDKLRAIGGDYGFTLTKQRHGIVRLSSLDGIPDATARASEDAADVLRAVADALGELVRSDIAAHVDTSAAPADPFLRLATPRIIAESAVATTYVTLRAAWKGRYRVRFRYRDEERTVEPHLVRYDDGRYYLVAFDRRPRTNDWRQFALDRITGPLARAGNFERRPIPPRYRGEDAIGLFKTGPEREVTIAISPRIADAVLARRWQSAQIVDHRVDAWSTIRLKVSDLGEAVRWTLGFGVEARIVAPDAAVDLARDITRTLSERYDEAVDVRLAKGA